jgi:hypothetical protein
MPSARLAAIEGGFVAETKPGITSDARSRKTWVAAISRSSPRARIDLVLPGHWEAVVAPAGKIEKR